MAIYHLSVKPISRSHGRSATASAAYRFGVEIFCQRSGDVHDYTRRSGVESIEMTLPSGAPSWANNRAELWNSVEQHETRKNSTVAREFEVSLPDGLNSEQRRELVREFSKEIATRHGIAVDAAIHTPGREGDHRNHHAHILTSTRRLGPEGFGEKVRELDSQITGPKEVERWRERWADLTNKALERAGQGARVDHRSLVAQRREALALGDLVRAEALDREPTRHLGPVPTDDLRRFQQNKKTEPATDRAREHLEINADNGERQSLLRKVREVREVIKWGIEQPQPESQALELARKWAEKRAMRAAPAPAAAAAAALERVPEPVAAAELEAMRAPEPAPAPAPAAEPELEATQRESTDPTQDFGALNDSIGIGAIRRINQTIHFAIQEFAAATERIAAAIERHKSSLDTRATGDFVGAGDAHRRKTHRLAATSAEMPGLFAVAGIGDDEWAGESQLRMAKSGHIRQREQQGDTYSELQPISAAETSTIEAKITDLEATARPEPGLEDMRVPEAEPELEAMRVPAAEQGVRLERAPEPAAEPEQGMFAILRAQFKKFFVKAPVEPPKPAPSIKFGLGSKAAVPVAPVPVSNAPVAEPPKPPSIKFGLGSKAEPPVSVVQVNWLDLTDYGLSVFKVGENYRDLVVAGASINHYEHELTELSFTRVGEHFRVPFTKEFLSLRLWRQAFPNAQIIKIDVREILIDESTLQEFLEANPVDSYDVTTLRMDLAPTALELSRPQNALEAATARPEPEPTEPTRPKPRMG